MIKTMPLLFITLLCFCLTETSNIKRDYLAKKYDKSQILGPNYEIFWKLKDKKNNDKDVLHLALHVATSGWVGFGIAGNYTGGMGGADILVGYVVENTISIEDRYALGNALPILDTCQDWDLVSGEESEENGTIYTTIEVKRKARSDDKSQDNDLKIGNMEVIWAFGTTDTFGYHGLVNRKPSTVNFYDINPIDLNVTGILKHDIRISNYSGPITRTHYGCQSFLLPTDPVVLYDIIAIEPLIATNNSVGVHHFNLFVCETNDSWWQFHFINGAGCNVPTASSCINNLYAAGSTNPRTLYLPENVGYRMGEGFYKYVYLQVHYDNPFNIPWVDDTGLRLYYTADLRDHSAAGVLLGDAQVRGLDLPPGQPWIDRQYDCTTECLGRLNESMVVVGAFLHAHQTAIQIYAYIKRLDPQTGNFKNITIVRDQFFKFGWQFVGAIETILIHPTDEIIVHCTYDTTSRQNITPMGLGSEDEMCNVILFYFLENNNHPNMSVCGYIRNRTTDEVSTLCQTRGEFIHQANPKVQDPVEVTFRTWGNVTFDSHCLELNYQFINQPEEELHEENLPGIPFN